MLLPLHILLLGFVCLFGVFLFFFCGSQSKFEAPILSLAPTAQVFLCFLNETSKVCPCYKSVEEKMDKLDRDIL